LRKRKAEGLKLSMIFLAGLIVGAATLIPTIIYTNNATGGTERNIVFDISNAKNIITVLMRFLSFASFEIPYMMGFNNEQRLAIIKDSPWVAPVALILLLTGWAQVGLFIVSFFLKNEDREWKWIKWLTFSTFVLVFICFFFSIRGPNSHMFLVVLPVSMFYSFYCYQRLFRNYKVWKKISAALLILGIVFHIALAKYNFPRTSLYTNRARVCKAINEKNYKMLGTRRSEEWGYGY
jgi:hypothetical protein